MKKTITQLTEKQIKDIESICKKYDSKINDEQIEIDKYNFKINELKTKREIHIDKYKRVKNIRNSEIRTIKDSCRNEEYEKINIKTDDVFSLTLIGRDNTYFGSNSIYTYEGITNMSILIEGETDTQYRLRVTFSDMVGFYNSNIWNSNTRTRSVRCNMKKLNFKDFLSLNNTEFKRDLNISNLID